MLSERTRAAYWRRISNTACNSPSLSGRSSANLATLNLMPSPFVSCVSSIRLTLVKYALPLVRAQALAEGARGLRVTATPGDAVRDVPGCTMGFAYWNPALRRQTQLINVQTGKLEPVQIERLADGSLDARGATVPAERGRIRTPDQTIDVWYAAHGGEWIGLDAQVRGGRQLSYRLPAVNSSVNAAR